MQIPAHILAACTAMLSPYMSESEVSARLARPAGQPMPEDDPLLTVAEAAARCRVTAWTIRHWIRSGALESRKLRGSVRVPRSALAKISPTPTTKKETT